MNIEKSKQKINSYLSQFDKNDTNTQFYDACQIAERALYELNLLQKSKGAILRAFAIGCDIKITKDNNFCYIELWHDETMHARAQYLPLDDHLDSGLLGAIDKCTQQFLVDIDQKDIPT